MSHKVFFLSFLVGRKTGRKQRMVGAPQKACETMIGCVANASVGEQLCQPLSEGKQAPHSPPGHGLRPDPRLPAQNAVRYVELEAPAALCAAAAPFETARATAVPVSAKQSQNNKVLPAAVTPAGSSRLHWCRPRCRPPSLARALERKSEKQLLFPPPTACRISVFEL